MDPDALRGVCILVVDDEPDTRATLQRVLGVSGASVTLASSVQDALSKLDEATEPFDVAIVDYYLLEDHGERVVRTLRDSAHPCCALMMTGSDNVDLTQTARQAGAERILRKPFRMKELQAAVIHVLNETRYWRAAYSDPLKGNNVSMPANGERGAVPPNPKAIAAKMASTNKLTQRQAQVLELILRGNDNAAIADVLDTSVRTVKHHVSLLTGKLGVKRHEIVGLMFETEEPS